MVAASWPAIRRIVLLLLVAGATCRAATAELTPESPEVQTAILKGRQYLARLYQGQGLRAGHAGLVTYALLKAGEPPETVVSAIERIAQKVTSSGYKPRSFHVYEAGVDLMSLEAFNAEQYEDEIAAIARYIIEQQHETGEWDYPNATEGNGDTSITQYALLGLWAAQRSGFHVPAGVWSRAAEWHLKTQAANGGFTYHPIPSDGGGSPLHSMTAAGAGSLHLARLHLYPGIGRVRVVPENREEAHSSKNAPAKPTARRSRYGYLVKLDLVAVEQDDAELPPTGNSKVKAKGKNVSRGAVDRAINGAVGWLSGRFTVDKPTGHPIYYLYTLERLSALDDRTSYGDHAWYAEGAEYLVKTQDTDGKWSLKSVSLSQGYEKTSFALLFLSQATADALKRPYRRKTPSRTGLLAGGRGLPDDLGTLEVEDGKLKSRQQDLPLDQLLSEIERADALPLAKTTQTVIETVRHGDREQLIGQIDRLKTLLAHPDPDVRKIACWALARSRDIRQAPRLVALLEDSTPEVVVEAHNALCVLSRQSHGPGIPPLPTADGPAKEVAAAFDAWRNVAVPAWKAWYRRNREYQDRDDLPPPRTR